MNKDKEKTKAIFRIGKYEHGKDIPIAIFPALAGTNHYESDCLCYEHVGQHGVCTTDIVAFTRPAKPSEYKALQEELEYLGYNLQIVKRFTRKDLESRKAQVQK